jgi:hypothetical protein
MRPVICPKCNPSLASLEADAASHLKRIMAFAEEMEAYTKTLPNALKPAARALTQCTLQMLFDSYIAHFQLVSAELVGQETPRKALTPPHYEEVT